MVALTPWAMLLPKWMSLLVDVAVGVMSKRQITSGQPKLEDDAQ